jgi:hypothetical protein
MSASVCPWKYTHTFDELSPNICYVVWTFPVFFPCRQETKTFGLIPGDNMTQLAQMNNIKEYNLAKLSFPSLSVYAPRTKKTAAVLLCIYSVHSATSDGIFFESL